MDKIHQTILSINNHLEAIYAKIEEKGGTIPEQKNMANLAEAILSIGA